LLRYGDRVSIAYEALDLTRTLQRPTNVWARIARDFWGSVPGAGPMVAIADTLERATWDYPKPRFGLTSTVIDGRAVAVSEEVILATPFCRLLRFSRAEARTDPRVLLVAPLSGHHATLVRETIRELLPDHDVYVTDWVDARLVPLDAGRFDLHDYIDLVPQLLRAIDGPAHVIAVCQPCVPVLAAAAVMAKRNDNAEPLSLTLMSGPVDARRSPTRVTEFARRYSIAALESAVIHRVPFRHPGRGRPVYPGIVQLQAFVALDVPRHVEAHVRHACEVALGAGNAPAAEKHRKFYDEYFAVMDLPAEFYLETVSEVFQRFTLATGEMVHRGERVCLEAIRRPALLTIEGENDDVTGIGQTRAAHELCTSIPPGRKLHHQQPGVGHYGTFSGSGWREGIAPVVKRFMGAHGQRV
jgi:poly(3-hydroxybutyrate) depolymerase